jgi:molybdopterin molybdotransferase
MNMVSVNDAKNCIAQNSGLSRVASVCLHEAVGLVLGEDIYSPLNVPAFDNSAMDGYAFNFDDLNSSSSLRIAYEIPAGSNQKITLQRGEAARIFTGAPIPGNADTVVMQELATVENGFLSMLPSEIKKGDHVRRTASQTKEGDLVLKKYTKITPAVLGYLAGMGISAIKCFERPKVYLLISGSELVSPGNRLTEGQIFESSSYALAAALSEMGITLTKSPLLEDDKNLINNALTLALQEYDVVLITGGISVGDYDFVHEILANLGVEQLFYKVKQKPGKPLFAGKVGQKLVVALPGNPNSTLTCFYQYVKPALEIMMGKRNHFPEPCLFELTHEFKKPMGLTHFVKGFSEEGKVEIFTEQESYKMNVFAKSNCIVELEEHQSFIEKGSLVKAYFI